MMYRSMPVFQNNNNNYREYVAFLLVESHYSESDTVLNSYSERSLSVSLALCHGVYRFVRRYQKRHNLK